MKEALKPGEQTFTKIPEVKLYKTFSGDQLARLRFNTWMADTGKISEGHMEDGTDTQMAQEMVTPREVNFVAEFDQAQIDQSVFPTVEPGQVSEDPQQERLKFMRWLYEKGRIGDVSTTGVQKQHEVTTGSSILIEHGMITFDSKYPPVPEESAPGKDGI